MTVTIEIAPLPEAVAKLEAKSPVAAALTSAEWSGVPLALRERAFFSARVESERLLAEMQKRIGQALTLARVEVGDGKTALMDRDSFIAEVRKLAEEWGVQTAGSGAAGTVQDIRSARRLGLIFDTQMQQAQGYARYKAAHDPDVLESWPAQRLVREQPRRVPRDWDRRWAEAGARVGWQGALQHPKVALKTSPIWAELSRFGVPWPPFDFQSGMGVEDVDAEEAERLGLRAPQAAPATAAKAEAEETAPGAQARPQAEQPPSAGDTPRSAALPEPVATPPDGGSATTATTGQAPATRPAPEAIPDFNAHLEASVKGLPDASVARLKQTFGDQVQVDPRTGTMAWQGNLIGDLFRDVEQVWQSGQPLHAEQWLPRALNLGTSTPELRRQAAALDSPWVPDLTNAWLSLRAQDILHMLRRHGPGQEHRADQRPLSKLDVELIPHVWRNPDAVSLGDKPRSLKLEKELLGRYVLIEFNRVPGTNAWEANTLYIKKSQAGSESLEAPLANVRDGSRAATRNLTRDAGDASHA